VSLNWPVDRGPSSDLESAAAVPGTSAAVPGTSSVLLVESGDGESDGRHVKRIFHARLQGSSLALVEVARWPVPVTNVEGSAVARVNGGLIFLFGERAEGGATTLIRWAQLSLERMAFGRFRQVRYRSRAPRGPKARPVSTLEVDSHGRIYTAGAFDSGDDNGPFRSVVWEIGRVAGDPGRGSRVKLLRRPRRVATLDGLKVESVATRRRQGRPTEVFAGTDDENYGGVLRLLGSRRAPSRR
jgi:hypothetical protein